jgi:quercetin dioxygenase-like cupin family protein
MNPTELPPAAPLVPTDLVGYQEGAVVSRTRLKRPGGTITLFAFSAGQGLAEHTTPFDAVVEILDGEAEITIAGTLLQVSAGQTVLMPANQPHALLAREQFKMLLTMIRAV